MSQHGVEEMVHEGSVVHTRQIGSEDVSFGSFDPIHPRVGNCLHVFSRILPQERIWPVIHRVEDSEFENIEKVVASSAEERCHRHGE